MFNTSLMIGQDDTSKSFINLNRKNKGFSKIEYPNMLKINSDITRQCMNTLMFNFSDGSVELLKTNEVYCLEYISDATDIVLPRDPQLNDWVLLAYDQNKSYLNLTLEEKRCKHKIYGNGHPIMGFNEPMYCDIPFLTLRLVFINHYDGWIIV